MKRIYLDNAATSWPKPQAVKEAVCLHFDTLGASSGRSGYQEAIEVERLISETRLRLARFIGCQDSSRIVFTQNGTDSLNLVLHGLLQENDHVVTTEIEHNSVLRPLHDLSESRNVSTTMVSPNSEGIVEVQSIQQAITPETRLVVISHASNVTGVIQPIAEIISAAHAQGAKVLVDAAQTAGHLPIDVGQLQVDYLASPGHKGLLGPLGTGMLYIAPGEETSLKSIRQGGTGTSSEQPEQPSVLPQKYESGSHNVPGILGLNAAIKYLTDRGVADVQKSIELLTDQLITGLDEIPDIWRYGPNQITPQIGVVSLNVNGLESHELATILDSSYRIQVRAGLHCAPLMHRSLNTLETGGTVRISLGAFNTSAEISKVLEALRELCS
ncbi:MAG: aminotransferase [Blastopirellula sp.]|nr:MAG: aminotransferase [Blastopirellula sp.]